MHSGLDELVRFREVVDGERVRGVDVGVKVDPTQRLGVHQKVVDIVLGLGERGDDFERVGVGASARGAVRLLEVELGQAQRRLHGLRAGVEEIGHRVRDGEKSGGAANDLDRTVRALDVAGGEPAPDLRVGSEFPDADDPQAREVAGFVRLGTLVGGVLSGEDELVGGQVLVLEPAPVAGAEAGGACVDDAVVAGVQV